MAKKNLNEVFIKGINKVALDNENSDFIKQQKLY